MEGGASGRDVRPAVGEGEGVVGAAGVVRLRMTGVFSVCGTGVWLLLAGQAVLGELVAVDRHGGA